MADMFAGIVLTDALFDVGDVVVVQREVLVDRLIQDKAAVALLGGGEGIEGFNLRFRGTEGDCLLLHALRIRRNLVRYQGTGQSLIHPSCAGWAPGDSVVESESLLFHRNLVSFYPSGRAMTKSYICR